MRGRRGIYIWTFGLLLFLQSNIVAGRGLFNFNSNDPCGSPSIIINGPNKKFDNEILKFATKSREEIYKRWFNKEVGGEIFPIQINIKIDPKQIDGPAGTDIKPSLDENGKMVIKCNITRDTVKPISCFGVVRHELTHALLHNQIRQKFPSNEDITKKIPSAIDEGIATFEGDPKMFKLNNTVVKDAYKDNDNRRGGTPSLKYVFSLKSLGGTGYDTYVYGSIFIDFLLKKGEPSKIINFVTRYLETDSWDEAAKIYGYNNFEELDNDWKKY